MDNSKQELTLIKYLKRKEQVRGLLIKYFFIIVMAVGIYYLSQNQEPPFSNDLSLQIALLGAIYFMCTFYHVALKLTRNYFIAFFVMMILAGFFLFILYQVDKLTGSHIDSERDPKKVMFYTIATFFSPIIFDIYCFLSLALLKVKGIK